jgi:hypothetical protein
MITDARLKEIKEITEKATPGPWYDNHLQAYAFCVGSENGVKTEICPIINKQKDAKFIAIARTAIPELLEYIETLQTDGKCEKARR